MPDRKAVCVQCAFCVQTAECTLKSLRHKGLRFVCTSAFRERERKISGGLATWPSVPLAARYRIRRAGSEPSGCLDMGS
jgi:hypothetical protein